MHHDEIGWHRHHRDVQVLLGNSSLGRADDIALDDLLADEAPRQVRQQLGVVTVVVGSH